MSRLIVPTPAGHGAPLLTATFGTVAEDFRVDEHLGMTPDGSGEHLWLHLEKRMLNTADVLGLLERLYAVGSADVGVSGLKDRRAVTRQWFSVRTPEAASVLESVLSMRGGEALAALFDKGRPPRPETVAPGSPASGSPAPATSAFDAPALVVLDAARHSRKLRRGTHVANAFEIVLRNVTATNLAFEGGVDPGAGSTPPSGREPDPRDDPLIGLGVELDGGLEARLGARLEARLEALGTLGFPNYLGPQRFGHGGRNVERARAWFRAPRKRTSRMQRSLWLSAARSALFNEVCAARVAAGNWSTLLDGEPGSLDGSRSFFSRNGAADDEAMMLERLERGDIHPSGPWWGRGRPLALGDCAVFEHEVLAPHADLREGLERAGLDQERRALRALPRELRLERCAEEATLRLAFTLAPGTFATTLLAELGSCVRADAATEAGTARGPETGVGLASDPRPDPGPPSQEKP